MTSQDCSYSKPFSRERWMSEKTQTLGWVHTYLYHAIQNTGNQLTGKPLCSRWHKNPTFPKGATCLSQWLCWPLAWYKIVMHRSLVVYHAGISHLPLAFPWYAHEPLGECVYRESDSWDVPWHTTRECWITSIYSDQVSYHTHIKTNRLWNT